ncbi:MAG: isoamylase early set domain-containing protein [Caldilineales bacterium]|nr:isoamylase early set domain-containing protein [Caldilineales bacterium]
MLSKQYIKSRDVMKVTFEVDFAPDAERVELLGEFNGWQPQQLRKLKSGVHKIAFDLAPGASYEYRYRIDGVWANDAAPDRYAPTRFGVTNSVVEC